MSTKAQELVKEIQEQPVALVSLYSKADEDITVAYGDSHLVISPRGKALNLDSSKLKLDKLGLGIIVKKEG